MWLLTLTRQCVFKTKTFERTFPLTGLTNSMSIEQLVSMATKYIAIKMSDEGRKAKDDTF